MCVDTTKWALADYLANAPAVGLPPSNFVPSSLYTLCGSIAANNIPPKAPSTFQLACQASLIIRGILYFKCNPGDCGSPTALNLTDAQLTGAAGQAATAGLSTAAQIAGAASGIASIAGAVLPGIGVAVSVISTIFANHAKAVANEQQTICAVAGVINQVIPFYDSAVRRGLISPTAAYTGMQSYLQQVIEALDGIQKSCDAGCVYIGILQAHYDFVERYYPMIAPPTAAPAAPGAPPVSIVAPGQPGGNSTVPQAAVSQVDVEDYFGNVVALGSGFFSSAAGTSMLPGVAGDYFTASQLAGNPWGLNINSVISDGEYAQIQATPQGAWAGGGGAGGAGKRPSASLGPLGISTTEWLLIAAVAVVAFMLISGKLRV